MHSRNQFMVWMTVFTIIFSTVWLANQSMANDNESTYYKIDKGLFYLKEVFETISRNYVEELDPETLSKSAIEGMLKEFDPYTVFFEDPGSHQMQMITRGRYGGVGMEIGFQGKKITVITPMEDTPAQRAGVRAGDVIVRINKTSVKTSSLEETSRLLRGKVGTSVEIEIERPGVNKTIVLNLVREEILIKDVSYAEFLEDGTAYIRLTAFSDKASQELKETIRNLKEERKIKRVVLDLRGNPGGLLTSAVEVANVFLPPGQLVVSTRGSHESESKFFTKEHPWLPTEPLVVLVDESSASAAEIVAGAIQDMDRGVLVGASTFGKGLVQKVYPIDRVSQAYLKITTAKYYVPSGRSIQKEDYKKNTEVFTSRTDSIEFNRKVRFFTQNGRVVYGGGGIQPDVAAADIDAKDTYLQNLVNRGFLFQFAVDYLSQRPEIKTQERVVVDEGILLSLKSYLEKNDFDFEIDGEKQLDEFLSLADKNKFNSDITDLVTVARQKLQTEKNKQFKLHQSQIEHLLEAEFAEKLSGSSARIKTLLLYDNQLKTAMQVLRNMQQYENILAVK